MRSLCLPCLLLLGFVLSCSSVETTEDPWSLDISLSGDTDASIPFPLLDSDEYGTKDIPGGDSPDTLDDGESDSSGETDDAELQDTTADPNETDGTNPDVSDDEVADASPLDATPDTQAPEDVETLDPEDVPTPEDAVEEIVEPGKESCCNASEVAGCIDADCEGIVCAVDAFCCAYSWDSKCVGEAEELCAICPGNCCEATAGPGCAVPECEAAVCSADTFCCETAWDKKCVSDAGTFCALCPGDCCEPTGAPGCTDSSCEAIVCAEDVFCCESAWDKKCVSGAEELCTLCPSDEPPPPSDCCDPKTSPGCNNPECENSVCAEDAFCCEFAWDTLCVSGAEELCALCPGDCCTTAPVPGCTDWECESAVCALDAYCCSTSWDAACVSGAEQLCTICEEEPPELGNCCAPTDAPGCLDEDCESLVCSEDPFCCDSAWDANCASGAELLCATCPGTCCETNDTPGCSHAGCEAAVCVIDPFCCSSVWDQWCAQCAAGGFSFGGANCAEADASCACPNAIPSHLELAEHWAPVWYHDTDDSSYVSDYITRVDFDGDFISSNNWENLENPGVDLSAVIYWSVVETETHWFILYADFHARDWEEDCSPLFGLFSEPCHENDMEGAMVVVRKIGPPHGTFEALYTEAHNVLHIHVNDPSIQKGTGHLEDVGVTFEDGSHPELYVESQGHGVCALYFEASGHCEHPLDGTPPSFPGGDGIVYRYQGFAETPPSGNADNVSYQLVSLEDTIWPLHKNICNGSCLFDGTFNYDGAIVSKAFDGDSWGNDKANPPWAWDDPNDGPVLRGDLFFRPAYALKTHLNIPGQVSEFYLYNPYLDALFP